MLVEYNSFLLVGNLNMNEDEKIGFICYEALLLTALSTSVCAPLTFSFLLKVSSSGLEINGFNDTARLIFGLLALKALTEYFQADFGAQRRPDLEVFRHQLAPRVANRFNRSNLYLFNNPQELHTNFNRIILNSICISTAVFHLFRNLTNGSIEDITTNSHGFASAMLLLVALKDYFMHIDNKFGAKAEAPRRRLG